MSAVMNAEVIDRPWLQAYPEGVPADIDASQYPSLVALMEESFKKHRDRVAYSFMGKDITYAQTDSLSQAFAAYLAKHNRHLSDTRRTWLRHLPAVLPRDRWLAEVDGLLSTMSWDITQARMAALIDEVIAGHDD